MSMKYCLQSHLHDFGIALIFTLIRKKYAERRFETWALWVSSAICLRKFSDCEIGNKRDNGWCWTFCELFQIDWIGIHNLTSREFVLLSLSDLT